jgi:hypothetical protein
MHDVILESAILGLLVGLLARGSFRFILHKRFQHIWLVFVSVACELFVSSGLMNRWLVDSEWAKARPLLQGGVVALVFFALLQFGSLFAFLLIHFHKPGLRLVLIGSLLNAITILANGGRMPIGAALGRNLDPAALQAAIDRISASPNYLYAPNGAPLLFLGDILPVHLLSAYMISIGDILISFGVFFFAWYLVRRPKKSNSSRNTRSAL